MKKRKIFLIFLSVVMIVSIVGCTKSKDIDQDIDFYLGSNGKITDVFFNDKGELIGILVEGKDEANEKYYLYGKANVSIADNTKIFKGDKEVSVDELKINMQVKVVFEGPVAESYPVQGTAKTVTIVD